MQRIGRVIHAAKDMATVEIKRFEACGDCTRCGSRKNFKTYQIQAFNLREAKEGDMVFLEARPGFYRRSLFFMFILPFLVLITSFYLADRWMPPVLSLPKDLLSFMVGFLSMCLFYFILSIFLKKENHSLQIVSVLETDVCNNFYNK